MLIWSMGVGWNIAALQPVSTRKIIHINEVGKCTKTEKQYLRCEQCHIIVMMSAVYRVTTRHFPGRNPICPVKHWNNIVADENIQISEEITSGELLWSKSQKAVAKTMHWFPTQILGDFPNILREYWCCFSVDTNIHWLSVCHEGTFHGRSLETQHFPHISASVNSC